MNRRNRNNYQTAYAEVHGSEDYPKLHGTVIFKQLQGGVLVTVEIYGLPDTQSDCSGGVYGFHIHEGGECGGNESDPFADAKNHFNPKKCPHPYHAGDLPPLFGNDGYAYMSVFTNRFAVRDIVGRVIIIHSSPDDFTTQPGGNAGDKIACGKIMW